MKIQEKIVIAILAVLLLAGTLFLHFRVSRPFVKISAQQDMVSPELTIQEVKAMLYEERKVDPNYATFDELVAIPGIGDKTATRIVEFRESGGVFYSEKDLLQVEGIGEKKLKKIREYIKFK